MEGERAMSLRIVSVNCALAMITWDVGCGIGVYRGTSLIKKRHPVGPYRARYP